MQQYRGELKAPNSGLMDIVSRSFFILKSQLTEELTKHSVQVALLKHLANYRVRASIVHRTTLYIQRVLTILIVYIVAKMNIICNRVLIPLCR